MKNRRFHACIDASHRCAPSSGYSGSNTIDVLSSGWHILSCLDKRDVVFATYEFKDVDSLPVKHNPLKCPPPWFGTQAERFCKGLAHMHHEMSLRARWDGCANQGRQSRAPAVTYMMIGKIAVYPLAMGRNAQIMIRKPPSWNS